jgi:hypothetical protein
MAVESRHNPMVKIARLLPPLARLYDHRNALLERVADLEKEISQLRADRASLDAERLRLGDKLNALASRRADGYIAEFDYPYTPAVRRWDAALGNDFCGRLIVAGHERYRKELDSLLAYKDAFTAIPASEPSDERQPYWTNPWLPPLDAISLSGLVTKLNPRRYVEIGSGNSTKFVRRAIADHGLRTRVISIDPHPRAIIDELCDEIVREKLEDYDLSMFNNLGAEDLLFVDNSHRSFQNSDVTVVFTEIIPCLGAGCHYGIHDIFLPHDYPAEWLYRYYNEQYLLMAYLLGGGAGDEIVLPVHYVQRTPDLLAVLDPILRHPALDGAQAVGGAFWMRKAAHN